MTDLELARKPTPAPSRSRRPPSPAPRSSSAWRPTGNRSDSGHLGEWSRSSLRPVKGVASGEEALAVARSKSPEALVTDIVMPRMSGLELAVGK